VGINLLRDRGYQDFGYLAEPQTHPFAIHGHQACLTRRNHADLAAATNSHFLQAMDAWFLADDAYDNTFLFARKEFDGERAGSVWANHWEGSPPKRRSMFTSTE
jgi:hypothetical protein